jgi:hypothetical protein
MSTPTKCAIPMAEPIRRTLVDLLGRPIEVKPSPGALKALSRGVIAEYSRTDGTSVGLFVVDLALAAYVGAALSMVPVGVASDSIRAGKLEANLAENTSEVFNILGSLLNGPTFPHCALKAVHTIPGPLPASVTPLVAKPAARLELGMTINGYGPGVFIVLVG